MTSTALSSLPQVSALPTATSEVYTTASGNSRRAPMGHVLTAGGSFYVNDVYPAGIGPTGTAGLTTRTPASLGYTIGQYIALLPTVYQAAATSWTLVQPTATDECDWIAMQTLANYLYTIGLGNSGTADFASGDVVLQGSYYVNRPIQWVCDSMCVRGANPQGNFSGTIIHFNGAGGTIDLVQPIFDFYEYDEFYYVYGRVSTTASGGVKAIVENIYFLGNAGSQSSAPTHYVSGIRLRAHAFCRISECRFNGVYDGIYITAPGLFLTVERNSFYGVHRDGLSIMNFSGNFTTTVWVANNEFGSLGRYAIIMDIQGTGAIPTIRGNSFEFSNPASYYIANPEWFVHGVIAGICYIGSANTIQSDSFWEGVAAASPPDYDADVHVVESTCTFANDSLSNIYVSSMDSAQARTDAAILYQNDAKTVTGLSKANPCHVDCVAHGFSNGDIIHLYNIFGLQAGGMTQVNGPRYAVANKTTDAFDLYVAAPDTAAYETFATTGVGVNSSAYGTMVGVGWRATKGTRYLDLTNTRNYRVGYGPSNLGTTSQLILQNLPYVTNLFFADTIMLDQTTASHFSDVGLSMLTIPVQNASGGHGGKVVIPFTSNPAPTYKNSSATYPLVLENVRMDNRVYGHYDSRSASGAGQPSVAGNVAWAPNTAYSAVMRVPSPVTTFWSKPALIVPTAAKLTGWCYQCTTGGTSHATTEPTWPTTFGATVSDGTCVWTARALSYETFNFPETYNGGYRYRWGNAAPTTGRWAVGEIMWNTGVSAGGTMGWVCTTAGSFESGTPATPVFKTFGAVAA